MASGAGVVNNISADRTNSFRKLRIIVRDIKEDLLVGGAKDEAALNMKINNFGKKLTN